MVPTALMWIRLLGIAAGIGAFWMGLSATHDDDQPGLELVSMGAVVLLVCLVATFWPV